MKRPARCPSCNGRIVKGTVVTLATSPPQRTVVCSTCAARAVLVLAPQQQETICEECRKQPARFCRGCVAQYLGRFAAGGSARLGRTAFARRQSAPAPATPAKPEEWGDG